MEAEHFHDSQLTGITSPIPRIVDYTLDDNLPACEENYGNRLVLQPNDTDLGALDLLPLELLQGVLSQADLLTLERFRRVNRRAFDLVESLPQYKTIKARTPAVFRAIFSIKTAPWISLDAVYEKLCTAECENCGDFGGYLHIITCRRVCFLCFSQDSKQYLPLQPNHASRRFGLHPDIIGTLPCMTSIPGTYSPGAIRCYTSLVLVDYASAYQAGINFHGSIDAMEKYVAEDTARKVREFTEQSAQTGSRQRPGPDVTDPRDDLSVNPLRFMAIIRVPWLNRTSHEMEPGFRCIGCGLPPSRAWHYRQRFTKASLREHLRQHANIEDSTGTNQLAIVDW